MNTQPCFDDVQIVDFPSITLAILPHQGDPMRITDTIRQFIAWRKRSGLPPHVSRTFNILHNDPDTTDPADYRIDLCVATNRQLTVDDFPMIAGLIPAGRCARLRQIGGSDNLRAAVHFLYANWLPQSGEQLRDFPVFVERVSFFPDVTEHEAITDIFLPLR